MDTPLSLSPRHFELLLHAVMIAQAVHGELADAGDATSAAMLRDLESLESLLADQATDISMASMLEPHEGQMRFDMDSTWFDPTWDTLDAYDTAAATFVLAEALARRDLAREGDNDPDDAILDEVEKVYREEFARHGFDRLKIEKEKFP